MIEEADPLMEDSRYENAIDMYKMIVPEWDKSIEIFDEVSGD